MIQGVVNRIFWNPEYNFVPCHQEHSCLVTVGREVTVALSTGSLRNCFRIQKVASWAGNSPGIILKTNGPLLFLLIDNWCYKIIIVPGPRTKLFDVKNLVRPYVELQVLDELFSCPIIYQYPRHYLSSVSHSQTLSLSLSRPVPSLPNSHGSHPPEDTQCQVCQSPLERKHAPLWSK